MKVVVKLMHALGLSECIHEVKVSDILVVRLDQSASTYHFVKVAMGVLATIICKLPQLIAHIGNLHVELPMICFVPPLLVSSLHSLSM